MVNTYSLRKDGQKKLQPNFSVYEWACPSGSDEIKIDTDLPPFLQLLRMCLGVDHMEVISGYRTQAYNDSLPNSAKTSQHLQGKAADIKGWLNPGRTKYLEPKYICCAAEVLGMPGIGLMQTAVHVDVRTTGKSYFDENFKNTRIENLAGNHKSWFTYCDINDLGFMKNLFAEPERILRKGDKGDDVRWLQFELVELGFLDLIAENGTCNIDGSYGSRTEAAVLAFQMAYFEDEAEWDGKFGPHSLQMLREKK